MNLGFFDWAIVFVSLGLMIWSVEGGRRAMKSVADFLAAGRSFVNPKITRRLLALSCRHILSSHCVGRAQFR